MNPWKLIGWIVLGMLLLALAFCGLVVSQIANSPRNAVSATENPGSANGKAVYRVKVVSLDCERSGSMGIAKVTIENVGDEIPFAKAYVRFVDSAGKTQTAGDSYFSPTTIPPGATASATIYSSSEGSESCRLASIQDGEGASVDF